MARINTVQFANQFTCMFVAPLIAGGSTYMLNDRLYPVPIHGPYSHCPICKTKREPETEYEKSFIRYLLFCYF